MPSVSKPWWEQVTALVSLSVSGAVTGLTFVPGAPAGLTSPSSMPIHLLAMEQSAQTAPAGDHALRAAIVTVANHFLRMASTRTPAEMEAIIWQHDSIDGVDHGESCAAFASLTLELAAHAVGQQSWVTGGTSYPWPLHKWADVRVEANPASPGIISVQQDAEAHHRWHPLGDGYTPRPGDWVLFDGHVEVVTRYSGGVLSTIGGDSLPNYSVNAHSYPGPLASQGVIGFVNNGDLPGTAGRVSGATGATNGRGGRTVGAGGRTADAPGATPRIPGARLGGGAGRTLTRAKADAAIPGLPTPAPEHAEASPNQDHAGSGHPGPRTGPSGAARQVQAASAAGPGSPAIPGLPASGPSATLAAMSAEAPTHLGRRPPPVTTAPADASPAEQAFINEIAPGAIAAQRRYGVPASVTIAQAIDESGWGSSTLATQDHNLFGIKGTGPAGSQVLPTSEYENGQLVSTTSPFRVYHNVAESISDHGQLLATSGYYGVAMAHRHDPNAFAAALTGVYATDPHYGTKLISLMRQYDLYRYDRAGSLIHASSPSHSGPPPSSSPSQASAPGHASAPGLAHAVSQPSPSSRTGSAGQHTPPAGPPSAHTAPGPATTPSPPADGSHLASSSPPDHPTPGQSQPAATRSPAGPHVSPGGAAIPGLPADGQPEPGHTATSGPSAASGDAAAGRPDAYQASADSAGTSQGPLTSVAATPLDWQKQHIASGRAGPRGRRYQHQIPPAVLTDLNRRARVQLLRKEYLYRDVAGQAGVRWELLAACDWMQCRARPSYSPVHGERLGALNPDGTTYRTKSEALEQCAHDLTELAWTVYHIDATAPGELSIRELANVFAAFRWGALLRAHHTSAMEFPYAVAGLTPQHTSMRWPKIGSPHAPDKPGARFRMPFGAVPIVLSLNYPATI